MAKNEEKIEQKREHLGFGSQNPNPKSSEVATWLPQRPSFREEAIGPPPRRIGSDKPRKNVAQGLDNP